MMRRPSRPLSAVLIASFLLFVSALPGSAQAFKGKGRAQGRVLDDDGKPLAGARVTMVLESEPSLGPEPAITDSEGRWALLDLRPGRWKLRVEADGFITADGWADVTEEGPAFGVTVQLRSLAEVSPFATENNTSTILSWLEKGNSFLAQGHYPEARAEYERAVPVLPPGERAQVLRSIARTHFLEGHREETIEALKQALLDAPHDGETRRLFTAVAEGYEQSAEARAWLARLDEIGAEALAEESGLSEEERAAGARIAVEPLPRREPTPHAVGAFSVSFTESSPLSSIETWVERYGVKPAEIAAVDPKGGHYSLAEETFEVFVPETYRPDRPAGLFVWVSPIAIGGVRREELRQILAAKNLIWIGANDAGNPRPKWNRMGLALDAAFNMQRLYNLDPERVYVGGYSGGGRVSSALIAVFPEVFQGAFCFMGVDHYRQIPVPDKPGAHWPPAYPAPTRETLRDLKENHRWALVTGELDFNRAQTRAYRDRFEQDGFQHVMYFEIPGASHYGGLDAEFFRRGLDALDAPVEGRRK